MRRYALAVMLSGAIGTSVTGCSSATPVMRGQSPHSVGGGPAGMNLPFQPVHRNFHTYQVPTHLSRPPENSAPALYQYPYYTLRGPTDFFMQ